MDDFLPKYFFETLILPLIGYARKEIDECLKSLTASNEVEIEQGYNNYKNNCYIRDDKSIIFYLTFNGERLYFSIKLLDKSPREDVYLVCCILEAYNKYGNFGEDRNAKNKVIQENIDNLIVQKGLFDYFFNLPVKNNEIDDLYKCLNNWSLKTYEGHKVCYGFLVDVNGTPEYEDKLESICGNFIDFISEEYSAVFTDGISSLSEIDNYGRFIKFHSLTEDNKIDSVDNISNVNLPFRFTQIINKYVVDSKIGWFLLNNGDMIFSKKGEIKFIKRSNKWLNFSKETFRNTIKYYIKDNDISKLLNSIYSTVLDISFAHSGGIIAVVNDKCDEWKEAISIENEKPLISRIDLFDSIDYEEPDYIYNHIKELYEKEIAKINVINEDEDDNNPYVKKELLKDLKKKLNKKRFLLEILNKIENFQDLDRKLRAELSGLDGAIIINYQGKIVGCGAIIANSAGSSGGGRGSAARTLSTYGGFAIKISTDGYVETFYKGARIYSIK